MLTHGDPSITPDQCTVQGFTPSTTKKPERYEDMTTDIEEKKESGQVTLCSTDSKMKRYKATMEKFKI